MDEKNKIITDEIWLKDLAQPEKPGFAAKDMLTCSKCDRTNPPNRVRCFYCAAELDIAVENLAAEKLNLRRLESWEKGFNVVACENLDVSIDPLAIAREVGCERETVEKMFSAGAELPLARVESEIEAELLCVRLKRHGVETRIVTDESLSPERGPKRIRGLEFQGEDLVVIDFNKRDRINLPVSDPLLIVAGTLFESKTASIEKKKRKTSKVLEQSETSADELVLDLYASADQVGFRIYERGFDFSCLDKDKGLLASENMPKLIRKLIEACPNARLDDRYSEVQDVLNSVWEIDSRKDSKGLQRSGFGKTDFASVVTLSNHTQFTRYSRLRRRLTL